MKHTFLILALACFAAVAAILLSGCAAGGSGDPYVIIPPGIEFGFRFTINGAVATQPATTRPETRP